MARNTKGTKRTQTRSNTDKPPKITKKNSDEQEYSSYSSTSFTLDVRGILAAPMVATKYDFLFNNEHYKNLIIQEIIEEFDQSFIKNNSNADDVTTTDGSQDDDHILNHRKEFGIELTTHGQMNITDGIQNKRNQCRVVAHMSVQEMYMCVRSQEFNPLFDCGDNAVFVFGGWLVYRCERMKTTGTSSYQVFQTKSKMLGNLTDIKSFHWLALHDNGYCSIRTLDEQAVLVSKDYPTVAKDHVEISTIQEHLDLSNRTSNWLKITPYQFAIQNGIEPVIRWQTEDNSTQSSTSTTMLDNNIAPPVNNSTQSSTTTAIIPIIESDYLENNAPKQVHNDTVVQSPILPFVQDDDCENALENLLHSSPIHTVNYLESSALPVGSSEIPSIQHDEESSNNNTEKTSLPQEYEEFFSFEKHLDISDSLTNSLFRTDIL